MRKGLLEPLNTDGIDEWPTGEVGIQHVTKKQHHGDHTHDVKLTLIVQQWAIKLSGNGEPLRFRTEWREIKDVTHLIPTGDAQE